MGNSIRHKWVNIFWQKAIIFICIQCLNTWVCLLRMFYHTPCWAQDIWAEKSKGQSGHLAMSVFKVDRWEKKKLQVGHHTGKWNRYFGHPWIYAFLDVLQKVQTTNYIKIRNINLHVHVPVSKAEKGVACELYQKYTDGEITSKECQNPGLQIQSQ